MDEDMNPLVNQAYEVFATELFGYVPSDPGSLTVTREHYTTELRKVEEAFELDQGHPAYFDWVMVLLGRSPKIEG